MLPVAIRPRIFFLTICYPKNLKNKMCGNVVLPSVLCVSESSPLTLRIDFRLGFLEVLVLRKMFGPERDK